MQLLVILQLNENTKSVKTLVQYNYPSIHLRIAVYVFHQLFHVIMLFPPFLQAAVSKVISMWHQENAISK